MDNGNDLHCAENIMTFSKHTVQRHYNFLNLLYVHVFHVRFATIFFLCHFLVQVALLLQSVKVKKP